MPLQKTLVCHDSASSPTALSSIPTLRSIVYLPTCVHSVLQLTYLAISLLSLLYSPFSSRVFLSTLFHPPPSNIQPSTTLPTRLCSKQRCITTPLLRYHPIHPIHSPPRHTSSEVLPIPFFISSHPIRLPNPYSLLLILFFLLHFCHLTPSPPHHLIP